MRVAVIDKCPGSNYTRHFDFEYEHFHMASTQLKKVLKKDVDLEIDLDDYDLVVLVGSEAAKHYAKISSVINMAGLLVDNKFIAIPNPGMAHFRPEMKPLIKMVVDKIGAILRGEMPKEIQGDFKGIRNTAEAVAYLRHVLDSNAPVIGLDTETSDLYPRDGYILGVSITHKENQGVYIDANFIDDEVIALLQEIIDRQLDDRTEVVLHNMKFDKKWMEYHFNIKFTGKEHDTMLMHYVLDENGSHALGDLAIKYTDYGDYERDLHEFKKAEATRLGIKVSEFTYDLIPFDIMWPYACRDTGATFALFHKFKPLIYASDKFTFVYDQLMIKGTNFLMKVEERGIPIDAIRMSKADAFLKAVIVRATDKLYETEAILEFEKMQGATFNPNSVVQLRKLLFDYLGLEPTGKKTDTGADSTDASVLEELALQHEVPNAVLDIRRLGKIQNTYISKILPQLDRDGRIRTNFNMTFTTSGRLSSSGKFNAQQIPRDNPIVKGCIRAPKGYVIVSQDLKTAEVYYAAVLSGDKDLQKVFATGEDLHSSIAHAVFDLNCTVAEVREYYPHLRQAAKTITFSILYGSGPANVAKTVSAEIGRTYTIDEAKEDIRKYFARFPKLKSWLDEQKTFIESHGYTYSVFGRKRRLSDVFSTDAGIVAHNIRSGVNMLIQSVASDVNLMAAIETQEYCDETGIDAGIFMLVHDSIVALVREDQVEAYCEAIQAITQKDRGVNIPGSPIGVDQEIGYDYSFGAFEKVYSEEGEALALNEA